MRGRGLRRGRTADDLAGPPAKVLVVHRRGKGASIGRGIVLKRLRYQEPRIGPQRARDVWERGQRRTLLAFLSRLVILVLPRLSRTASSAWVMPRSCRSRRTARPKARRKSVAMYPSLTFFCGEVNLADTSVG